MITEINTPTQASREMPVTMKMMAEASTDAERIASNMASDPDATSEPEFTCSPFALTYRPRMILTATATAMITRESIL